jgi:hypothetical protein
LLALEWANYVITTAFILVRMFKILLVATSSIGRIDRPFLAAGVGNLGPLELDPYPTIHTRDLIAHDAHRHPYIETLGLMYLMKLRYADDFGNRAGSAWRLIFVYTLMPWFHKYRIHDDDPIVEKIRIDDGKDEVDDTDDDAPMELVVLAHSIPGTKFRSSDVGVPTADDDDSKVDTARAMREMEAENACLKAEVERLTKRLAKKKLKKAQKSLSSSSASEENKDA